MLLAHTWIHSGEPGWWDGWFQRRWVPTKEIKEEKPRNPTLFRACVFGRRALVCRGALLAKDTALKPLTTDLCAQALARTQPAGQRRRQGGGGDS